MSQHPSTIYPPVRIRRWAAAGASLLALVGGGALIVQQAPSASAQTTTGTGWIRFGHFSPANGPVRVSIDDKVLTTSAAFESVTPYRSVADGAHTVTLTDVDAPHTVLRDRVTIATGGAVTVGAVQEGSKLALESFADNFSPGPSGDARVRIIDAAPSASDVRVALQKDVPTTSGSAAPSAAGSPVLRTPVVPYATASGYVDVAAGSYTVTVRGGTGAVILTGSNWPVVAGTVASVVVVQVSGKPTLEVLSDAVGAADPPVGGMVTGFGGAAALLSGDHHPADHGLAELLGVLALLGFGVVGWRIIRRPGRGLRLTVLATAAVVVVATAAGATAMTERGAGPTATGATAGRATLPAAALPTPVGVTTRPVISHPDGTTISLAGSASGASGVAPTSLTISSIGVQTSLIKLGRDPDGSAQVPTTTAVAGWYTDGPAPGQPGPAVILGHVDSFRGPGVFFGLHELVPGALVRVGEAGATLTFVVQRVDSYAKTSFPTAAVFGPTPDRALRLITCGGTFDYATGHYDNNVVVFATEVGSPPNPDSH